MEPLATAKMKATTTVTLFIIISLIAVGWSTVEVNVAADAAELSWGPSTWGPSTWGHPPLLREFCPFSGDCVSCGDQNSSSSHRTCYACTSCKEACKEDACTCKEDASSSCNDASYACTCTCSTCKNQAKAKAKTIEAKTIEAKTIEAKTIEAIEAKTNPIEAKTKTNPIEAKTNLDHLDLDQKKKKKKKKKSCCVSCNKQRQNLGDIWITVGFSTIFFFFMVLTLRVFRDLKKQRKSCRKTHAFPVDDLGGVTNLLG